MIHKVPPPNKLTDLREAIRAEALRLGFSRGGFTSAEPLAPAWQQRWERWRGENKAGAMRYLMRERPRRSHPRDLFPEARAAVVVLAGYYDGNHSGPPDTSTAARAGKIARYAWGRDYHLVMREGLGRLGEWITERCTEFGIGEKPVFRACIDSTPLDERALAARAGLGFIGKNTLLLDPERGSWSLIGVLLTSLELPPDAPLRDPAASCGGCRRCLDACPTHAFDDAYRLDPRRCASYLTIEQKDAIPSDLAAKMEGWALGCDICQEVCPFNREPLTRLLPGLAAREGAGPWLTGSMLDAIPSGKALERQWGHTPLSRPGLKGLRRNLDAATQSRKRARDSLVSFTDHPLKEAKE